MLLVTLAVGQVPYVAVRAAAVSIALTAGAIAAALAVLLSSRLRSALALRRLLGHPSAQRFVAGAGEALIVLRRRPGTLARAAALAVVSQGLQVCAVLVIGLALELSLQWYRYFLCVPVIFIVSAVPVTPGGLGVAEQLYLVYLGGAGGAGGVLALALLARLAWIVAALPGALVLVLGPKLPAAEAIRTELDAAEAQGP